MGNLKSRASSSKQKLSILTLTSKNLAKYETIPYYIDGLVLSSENCDKRFSVLLNNLNNKTIKSIDIQINQYNMPITRLHNGVEILKINSDYFNQELDLLPDGLLKLTLYTDRFNKKLDDLPTSLQYLELKSSSFNNNLQNLPINLTSLKLNIHNFSKILKTSHLDKLINFRLLCYNLDNSLNNLPNNIENIKLSGKLNIELNNLPNKISKLVFESHSYNNYLDNLPFNLNHLEMYLNNFNRDLLNLPNKIQTMVLNLPKFDKTLNIQNLINLESLSINCFSIDNSLDKLSNSLQDLVIICNNMNVEPDLLLLDKLTRLKIMSPNFNQELDKLPSNLIEFSFIGDKFNKPIEKLPLNLKTLNIVSNEFNQKLDKLPTIINLVVFSPVFKQDITDLNDSIVMMHFLSNSIGIDYVIKDNLKYIVFVEPDAFKYYPITKVYYDYISFNSNNKIYVNYNNILSINTKENKKEENKKEENNKNAIRNKSIIYISNTDGYYSLYKENNKFESNNKNNVLNYYYDLCYSNNSNNIIFDIYQFHGNKGCSKFSACDV